MIWRDPLGGFGRGVKEGFCFGCMCTGVLLLLDSYVHLRRREESACSGARIFDIM